MGAREEQEFARIWRELKHLDREIRARSPHVAGGGGWRAGAGAAVGDGAPVADAETGSAGSSTDALRDDTKPGVKLVGNPGDTIEDAVTGDFVPTIEAVKDNATPVVRRGFRARRGAVDYGYLQYEYQHLAALAAGANITKTGLIVPLLSTGCLVGSANGLGINVGDGLEVDSNELKATSGVPTGLMAPFGGAAAPDGWLLCDGSAVSRTTYADLFAVLGTAFGAGNGTTTFNVPDCRRRRVMGLGSGDSRGASEGEAVADRLLAPAAPTIQCAGGGGPPTTDQQQDSIMDHGTNDEVQSGTGAPTTSGASHTITPHAHNVTDIEASAPTAADHPYLLANWIIKT